MYIGAAGESACDRKDACVCERERESVCVCACVCVCICLQSCDRLARMPVLVFVAKCSKELGRGSS